MDRDPPSIMLKKMLEDIRATYEKYLAKEHLEDCAWSRVIYYSAAEHIVVQNPLPIEAMQYRLKRHMTLEKTTAIESYQKEIQDLLNKTISERVESRYH